MELFWIILVVVVASLVKGITGFGFALIALPPLLIWYPSKFLIPVLLICNLVASFIIVLQKKDRRLIEKRYHRLIVWGGVFTIFGALTLKFIPDHLMIHVLSIFFIVLSVLSIVKSKIEIKISKHAYPIAGAIVGFLTGSVSVSGPPLALFLHSAKADNQQFREIFAWFSLVTAIIALVSYGFVGLLSLEIFTTSLWFLPILFIGSYIGKRINHKMPASIFKFSSMVLTLISSLILLLQ
ncbi:MAG: sulfite exporter TauE/SafE family protein [Bacteroidales bacterium]|nr:sulfite exporter TauE/SafE family protein [Bacteroidales bacterium]